MNINNTFPSTYIKASDLDGASVTVTIREVKIEQIGRDRDQKPVVYFEGKTKGLVLNKTNARKIVNLIGETDTDDWPGHRIAIFPTETEFSGETVECIRVKAADTRNSRTAQTQAARRHDDKELDSDAIQQQRSAAGKPDARAVAEPSSINDRDIPF